MDICKEVVVEEDRNFVTSNVDIAHRVGRPNADSGKGKKPRPVIIRFTSRTARDLTWKAAQGNDFLKKNKMYSKEVQRPEMKHSDQEIKQPSKQQEPICPVASKMQNGHMLKKSTITSQTAETHGACGKPFRPSLTTSPRHRPVMMIHPSPIHSTTFIHGLKSRTTHLHKNCPHLPTTRRSVCLQPM